MSDRYQNEMACGIEPEREGDEPTLEQWRDRCRQLWRAAATQRGDALEDAAHWHDMKAVEARAEANDLSRIVGTTICEIRAQWHDNAAASIRALQGKPT